MNSELSDWLDPSQPSNAKDDTAHLSFLFRFSVQFLVVLFFLLSD
jgi:hypothetical protein